MTDMVFCEKCRKEVNYTITEKNMAGKIKGTEYEYKGKEARCAECGSYVYIPQINDDNLESLYNEYRKRSGIISLADVRLIPQKYKIGKRPLSVLLGWGEQTFSRYYDGDVPSKQYSEILKKVCNEPSYFLEILESGKDLIKPASYQKSKTALDNLTNTKSNGGKIYMAIAYILHSSGDTTPLALQKLLYYIQGFYYAFNKAFLFPEDCEAWAHGPVYKRVYYCYNNYHYDPIKPNNNFDEQQLTTSEKSIFDSVIDFFSCYSGKVLECFTHNETPWLHARGELAPNAASNRVISKESIGEYFLIIKEKYNMIVPNDIKNYAVHMFTSCTPF